MKSFKNHIAAIVLGIFVFPIIFQSVHIVRHHAHDCEENIASGIPEPTNQDVQKEILNSFSEIDHCPICDYQFTVNSLPEASVFIVLIPIIDRTINETVTAQPRNQLVHFKSPRGPPTASFM